jgi:uncharacterized protein YcbK (DUF882 family)
MRRPGFTTLLLLAALTVGGAASAAPAGYKPRTHHVYPGQTLGMIAKRYRVSVEALRHANGLDSNTRIKPKQRLLIPAEDDKDGSRTRLVWSQDEAKAAGEPRHQPDEADDSGERSDAKKPNRAAKSANSERPSNGKKPPGAPEYAKKPRKAGFVTITSLMGVYRGHALNKDGKIAPAARRGVSAVLASWRTGAKDEIDERLIRMLVRVSDHFGGRQIRIVSGYRPYSPQQYTAHSRHNLGRAADFSVVGVPNTVVRDYCRTLPNVGVGFYPNSTFIHLDVRETPTYWVDYSGPGERPRYANAEGRDPGNAGAQAPANMSAAENGRQNADEHDGPPPSAEGAAGAPNRGGSADTRNASY